MNQALIAERLGRIQAGMKNEAIDCLLLSPSPNMFFLTGINTHTFERLYVLLISPEGPIQAVVPAMNKSEVAERIGFIADVQSWSDGEDPVKYVKSRLNLKSGTVAFDDNMTALHLLALMPLFPGFEHVAASRVMSGVRLIKDDYDRKNLASAAEVADAIMLEIVKDIRPGVSEGDIIGWIKKKAIEHGAEELGFSPIVAGGPNSANPHHFGGSRRLEQGDALFIDFGVKYAGYHSDITRSFVVGKASAEMKELYAVVRAAQEAGVQAGKPGVPCEAVDLAARKVIFDAGFGDYCLHRTGHGLGLEIHEDPYMVIGNKAVLRPGMVYSVEPGLYMRGKFGFRLEDIVIQADDGAQRLNHLPRELREL